MHRRPVWRVCVRVRVICAFLVLELSFFTVNGNASKNGFRECEDATLDMARDWNIVFLDKNVFEQHKAGWADGDLSVCVRVQ